MVFFVIPMMNGIIDDVQGFELYADAEAHAVEVAKGYGVNANDYADIEEQLNRGTDGRDVYIESGPYFEAQDGESFDKYTYEYDGRFVSDMELILILQDKGYTISSDTRELLRWVINMQNGEGDWAPVPTLKYKHFMSYRGGEKKEIVFAQDTQDAVDMVCEWNHHCDMWEYSYE